MAVMYSKHGPVKLCFRCGRFMPCDGNHKLYHHTKPYPKNSETCSGSELDQDRPDWQEIKLRGG